MNTYHIDLFNSKREVCVSYTITADSKKSAVKRAVNDQQALAPGYRIEVLDVRRVDD